MEPRIYDRTQGLFEEHFTAANRTLDGKLDGKLDSGITHCDFLPNRSVAYLEAPNRSAEYVISLGSNLRPISQYRGAALDP
jgi:hypothetical protein